MIKISQLGINGLKKIERKGTNETLSTRTACKLVDLKEMGNGNI